MNFKHIRVSDLICVDHTGEVVQGDHIEITLDPGLTLRNAYAAKSSAGAPGASVWVWAGLVETASRCTSTGG